MRIGLAVLIIGGLMMAAQAQSPTEGLQPMSTHIGTLADSEMLEWRLGPTETQTTLLLETLDGSLDPAIDLLDELGAVLLTNDNYAPNFSTDARLVAPAGGPYVVRIRAVYGAGTYRLTALPGDMMPQWADDFSHGLAPYWNTAVGASAVADGLHLMTGFGESRFFAPKGVSGNPDMYIEARFQFDQVRANTSAGLVGRGRLESNRQITGVRLLLTPNGAWSLETNDISGNEHILADGTLAIPDSGIQLGLLIQAGNAAAFADGQLLAEAPFSGFEQQSGWGLAVFDGAVTVSGTAAAISAIEPLNYPAHLDSWDSLRPDDITAELVSAGILPESGARQFSVPYNIYTVSGLEQRNFLITPPEQVFDRVVIGGTITITQNSDVGCGLVTGFYDRANKLLAYVDGEVGAGLVWWQNDLTPINNYTLLDNPADGNTHRLVLIVQDYYTSFYVDGQLAAQNIIPRRAGNVGVGFINYDTRNATCEFRDVWVWR